MQIKENGKLERFDSQSRLPDRLGTVKSWYGALWFSLILSIACGATSGYAGTLEDRCNAFVRSGKSSSPGILCIRGWEKRSGGLRCQIGLLSHSSKGCLL